MMAKDIKTIFTDLPGLPSIGKALADYQKMIEELPRRMRLYRKAYDRLEHIAKTVAKNGWAIPLGLPAGHHMALAIRSKSSGQFYAEAIDYIFSCDPDSLESVISSALRSTTDKNCHALLEQSIEAFRQEKWAISCAGMFCVIESLWPTNDHGEITQLKHKIVEYEKIIEHRKRTSRTSVNFDSLAIRSTIYCLQRLYSGDRLYLGYVARNRLLHGWDIDHVSRIDCIKLIVCLSNMAHLFKSIETLKSGK